MTAIEIIESLSFAFLVLILLVLKDIQTELRTIRRELKRKDGDGNQLATDCISRQAAVSEIMDELKDRSLHDDPATPEDYAEGYDEGTRNAAVIVQQLPSVDVVSAVHGRWIVHYGNWADAYECDQCHHESKEGGKYCSNCGIRMGDSDG